VIAAAAVFAVTAYSLGCDAPGPLTKAGTHPVAGFTVAADPRVLPLGTILHVEGLGQRQIQDVGGGVVGRHVDVYVDSCREARAWGRQRRRVTVLHVPQIHPRQTLRVTGAEALPARPRAESGGDGGDLPGAVARSTSQLEGGMRVVGVPGAVRPSRRPSVPRGQR
jgi:3D (Asp-Asp-Asp) domain-containing protein